MTRGQTEWPHDKLPLDGQRRADGRSNNRMGSRDRQLQHRGQDDPTGTAYENGNLRVHHFNPPGLVIIREMKQWGSRIQHMMTWKLCRSLNNRATPRRKTPRVSNSEAKRYALGRERILAETEVPNMVGESLAPIPIETTKTNPKMMTASSDSAEKPRMSISLKINGSL